MINLTKIETIKVNIVNSMSKRDLVKKIDNLNITKWVCFLFARHLFCLFHILMKKILKIKKKNGHNLSPAVRIRFLFLFFFIFITNIWTKIKFKKKIKITKFQAWSLEKWLHFYGNQHRSKPCKMHSSVATHSWPDFACAIIINCTIENTMIRFFRFLYVLIPATHSFTTTIRMFLIHSLANCNGNWLYQHQTHLYGRGWWVISIVVWSDNHLTSGTLENTFVLFCSNYRGIV